MPLKKVSEGGKECWKWGDSGKIYCGSDGRSKALRQGRAELENGAKASSFKDRGITAMQIKEIDEELALEAAKMSPPASKPMRDQSGAHPMMDVPAQGYESVDSESLVSEDCQTNLMQDRMSENQDYVPSDSE